MVKKQENTATAGGKSIKAKSFILLFFAAVFALVFVSSTALLFVGMLPTLAISLVERGARSRLITIGAMNLVGCWPFLLDVWSHGNSVESAISVLLQPMNIIIMYGAAAFGYFLDWALQGVISGVMHQKAVMRKKAIEKEQEDLVQKWGREVTGTMPLDEFGFPAQAQNKTS